MALDTYLKRGSATNLSLPFRPWISVPAGSSSFGSRLSFLHFEASAAVTQIGVRLTGRVVIGKVIDAKTEIEKILPGAVQ